MESYGLAGVITLIPGCRELQGAHESRVKTRSHLYSHCAEKQTDVHLPEVGLLPPWCSILFRQVRENGIGETFVNHVEDCTFVDDYTLSVLLVG